MGLLVDPYTNRYYINIRVLVLMYVIMRRCNLYPRQRADKDSYFQYALFLLNKNLSQVRDVGLKKRACCLLLVHPYGLAGYQSNVFVNLFICLLSCLFTCLSPSLAPWLAVASFLLPMCVSSCGVCSV